jgi:hypothetical protein
MDFYSLFWDFEVTTIKLEDAELEEMARPFI